MRESCTYGSVRGVRGNSHPYRATFAALHMSAHGIVSRVTPVHTAMRNCQVSFASVASHLALKRLLRLAEANDARALRVTRVWSELFCSDSRRTMA
jgi:hypothetical protein